MNTSANSIFGSERKDSLSRDGNFAKIGSVSKASSLKDRLKALENAGMKDTIVKKRIPHVVSTSPVVYNYGDRSSVSSSMNSSAITQTKQNPNLKASNSFNAHEKPLLNLSSHSTKSDKSDSTIGAERDSSFKERDNSFKENRAEISFTRQSKELVNAVISQASAKVSSLNHSDEHVEEIPIVNLETSMMSQASSNDSPLETSQLSAKHSHRDQNISLSLNKRLSYADDNVFESAVPAMSRQSDIKISSKASSVNNSMISNSKFEFERVKEPFNLSFQEDANKTLSAHSGSPSESPRHLNHSKRDSSFAQRNRDLMKSNSEHDQSLSDELPEFIKMINTNDNDSSTPTSAFQNYDQAPNYFHTTEIEITSKYAPMNQSHSSTHNDDNILIDFEKAPKGESLAKFKTVAMLNQVGNESFSSDRKAPSHGTVTPTKNIVNHNTSVTISPSNTNVTFGKKGPVNLSDDNDDEDDHHSYVSIVR